MNEGFQSILTNGCTVNTVISRVFTRTVTNVGLPNSSYKATVTTVKGIEINVIPDVLSFTSLGQKLSFQVRILGKLTESMQTASFVWDDSNFQVRSPIVVFHYKLVQYLG
ncbi:cucumisin-like [Quillaja saponaria]|uniref:Cucumisin-like n=1 Tax=Quillaja saponaria TaxID=32244 RepID=A0AAD7PRV9_QUISA|nr:cucumisin-like [Quillaja saponaria]